MKLVSEPYITYFLLYREKCTGGGALRNFSLPFKKKVIYEKPHSPFFGPPGII